MPDFRNIHWIGHLDLKADQSLWLAWNEQGLLQISWTETDLRAGIAFVNADSIAWAKEVSEPYRTVLIAYFEGQVMEPSRLPVAPQGTAFQKKVWSALRDVPRGTVRSYGQIAAQIGQPGAARAVGTACGANPVPIAVPCHRIVGSKQALGGYSGGLHRKIQLLALEGIRVDQGRVRSASVRQGE